MCGRDDDQAVTAGKFIKEFLKAKTVFIVDDKTTYSQGLAENVAKKCKELGVKVLVHDHVNQGDKDFSAVLTKIKSAKPDLFYMSLQNSSSGSLMAIQAKRFGLKMPILTQDAVYHPQFITIAKEATKNVYFTFGFVDKSKDSFKKYSAKYMEMFGKPGAYSGYAYDGAYVLLTAIKKAQSTDPAKIKAEIMKMEFEGASKTIKFFPNGDSTSNYIIQIVKGDEFVPYWNPETSKLY
jgi:branched-chain amino acid transport system substrate-binding protein